MKFKKLLAAIMATAAFAGVIAAAEGIDNYYFDILTTDEIKIGKTLTAETDESARIFFLNYDEKGRLSTVDTCQISDFSRRFTYEELGIDSSKILDDTKAVLMGEYSCLVKYGRDFEEPEKPDELITMMLGTSTYLETNDENIVLRGWTVNDEKMEITIPADAEINLYSDYDDLKSLDDLYGIEVISIEYDIDAGFENSDYYNIYASRDCIEDNADKIFEENGVKKYYTRLGGEYICLYDGKIKIEEKGSFTGYLDVFGRIVSIDVLGDYSRNPAMAYNKGI